jgi:hypothetical protein
MLTTKVLRILVVCEIALSVATLAASALFGDSIPAIDEYLEGPGASPLFTIANAGMTATNLLIFSFLVAFAGIYIASLVGLLLLRRWSRRLYVIAFIAGVCLYPFLGSSLVDPLSGTIDYLLAACSGAILATLYLSDITTLFDSRTPNKSLERGRDG